MTGGVVTLLIGPAEHGVVRLAEQAHATGCRLLRYASAAQAVVPPDASLVHTHFTDRLFGPDCAAAAAEFGRLVQRSAVPVAVTLHDLPLPDDDPGRYQRRAAAYSAVVGAATGPVIVNSAHEAALLQAFRPATETTVIALPVTAQPTGLRPTPDREVTILGFVYPGKGHAEALAALPSGFGLHALGRAADGHADHLTELADQAAAAGRRFTVSGWVPDEALVKLLRTAAIPLVAHRQLSASASISSWLAAGRRPLVPTGPYTRELLDRWPGSLLLYPVQHLAVALAAAVVAPDSTWLASDVELGPSPQQVGGALRRLFTGDWS